MPFVTPAHPAQRNRRQASYARQAEVLPMPTSNVLDVFERAEDDYDSYAEGTAWYLAANSIAREHADTYDVTIKQAVGVLAALSPQTGWADNIHLAGEFWRRHAQRRPDLFTGHTTDAVRKCQAIARNRDPYHVLGGRKVRSFYANILRPTVPGPVTIDRHAIAVLLGRPLPASDPDARAVERAGNYQRAAAAYRSAAREVGLLPHQMQAVVWVQWRKETGADKFNPLPKEF